MYITNSVFDFSLTTLYGECFPNWARYFPAITLKHLYMYDLFNELDENNISIKQRCFVVSREDFSITDADFLVTTISYKDSSLDFNHSYLSRFNFSTALEFFLVKDNSLDNPEGFEASDIFSGEPMFFGEFEKFFIQNIDKFNDCNFRVIKENLHHKMDGPALGIRRIKP